MLVFTWLHAEYSALFFLLYPDFLDIWNLMLNNNVSLDYHNLQISLRNYKRNTSIILKKSKWQKARTEQTRKAFQKKKRSTSFALLLLLNHCIYPFVHIAQKMKFSIKDFSSKCNQIRRKLRIWSHLLEKSLMENFVFCAVHIAKQFACTFYIKVYYYISNSNVSFEIFFFLVSSTCALPLRWNKFLIGFKSRFYGRIISWATAQ